MSYLSKDLSVISYANGFTLWHYATLDATPMLNSENYFAPAADMLRAGDMILANSDLGNNLTSQILQVASVQNNKVKVNSFASAVAS